ncbi:hypothetical protein [Acinetobacter baumannii]|uniref:hypothetical protein n=1 Tax=Acinetobacter baumannii TaxID=470 RepID=UPI000F67BD25|nr:hypothetical protein [Acinetobacter baumannii]RSG20320.1 hypothetical protein EGU23_06630 [Acinetobacter baumannii]RSG82112.1 hypothetical protein EGU43_14220 [Acinetobacter baumannii]
MSEFKVGDKITTLACRDILTVTAIGRGHFLKAKGFNCHGMKDGECNVLDFQVKHATLAEIRIGYRIDNPCKCCNGHGEVGNMLESFACPECNGDRVERNDMGDDSHIENHISPNCKVEDV